MPRAAEAVERQAAAAVVGHYGLTERVALAAGDPRAPGEHELEPLCGHVELVDAAGVPVTDVGEAGRIVGTGYLHQALPLLLAPPLPRGPGRSARERYLPFRHREGRVDDYQLVQELSLIHI